MSSAPDPAGEYVRVKRVFLAVVGAPRAEQAAALDRLCQGDLALREEVASLLAHHHNESISGAPAAAHAALIGRQIGGIRVEKELGAGGMSTVYYGYDERLHRPVALKALRVGWRMDAATRTRFLLEARILSQLKHENICEIFGYEETPDGEFLVLEYIDGRSLREALEAGLSLRERDRLGMTLAEVLQVAHSAGVVHRDLKPENVMLTREGRVKVLDFGIARVDGRADSSFELLPREGPSDAAPADASITAAALLTRVGHVLGTLHYMSPEQARGEPVAPASDIFSLGLLLHEVYGGRPAYPRDLPPAELRDRMRRGAVEPIAAPGRRRRRLLARMLSPSASDRPTAFEVAQEVRQIRDTRRRWLRRGLLVGVLGLIVLAGLKYVADITRAWAQAEAVSSQLEVLGDMLLDDLFNKLAVRDRRAMIDRVWRMPIYYLQEIPRVVRSESTSRLAQRMRTVVRVRLIAGDSAGARVAAERSLWLDELNLRDLSDAEWHEQLVAGIDATRSPAEGRAEPAGEVEFYRRARDFYAAQAAAHAGAERQASGLASIEMALGSAMLRHGEFAAAEAAFLRAADIYAGLAEQAIMLRARRWQFLRSEALVALAEANFRGGRLDEALAVARLAAQIDEDLREKMPYLPLFAAGLAQAHLLAGQVRQARGEASEALRSFEAARALLEPLHESDPGYQRWFTMLGLQHLYVARLARQRGDAQAASAALLRAEAITAEIGGEHLLNARDARAQILLELGREADARALAEPLVAMGWHEDATCSDFAALVRRAGLLPEL